MITIVQKFSKPKDSINLPLLECQETDRKFQRHNLVVQRLRWYRTFLLAKNNNYQLRSTNISFARIIKKASDFKSF